MIATENDGRTGVLKWQCSNLFSILYADASQTVIYGIQLGLYRNLKKHLFRPPLATIGGKGHGPAKALYFQVVRPAVRPSVR